MRASLSEHRPGVWVLALLLGCQGHLADPSNAGAPVPMPPHTTPPAPPVVLSSAPQPPVFSRLTAAQYRHAIEDAFGLPLPRVSLEQDTSPHLFVSIGASSTSPSEVGAQRYHDAALEVTTAVFADPSRREALAGCEPSRVDDSCIPTSTARRPVFVPSTSGSASPASTTTATGTASATMAPTRSTSPSGTPVHSTTCSSPPHRPST